MITVKVYHLSHLFNWGICLGMIHEPAEYHLSFSQHFFRHSDHLHFSDYKNELKTFNWLVICVFYVCTVCFVVVCVLLMSFKYCCSVYGVIVVCKLYACSSDHGYADCAELHKIINQSIIRVSCGVKR